VKLCCGLSYAVKAVRYLMYSRKCSMISDAFNSGSHGDVNGSTARDYFVMQAITP